MVIKYHSENQCEKIKYVVTVRLSQIGGGVVH